MTNPRKFLLEPSDELDAVLKSLQAVAAFDVPDAAGPVGRGRDDLVGLRVERDLGDLTLVADQDRLAGAGGAAPSNRMPPRRGGEARTR